MTLFVEDGAPVMVQGMTGHQGMVHTAHMMAAGTNILAGVNARKAGMTVDFDGPDGQPRHVPVYADCAAARQATGARTSVVFVPPRFAKDAMVEAIEAGITLIVVITEGIPVADTAYCVALARERGCRIVGPNCPGLMTMSDRPNGVGVDLGIIPQGIAGRGPLGLVSKSGTLTYQLMGGVVLHRLHRLPGHRRRPHCGNHHAGGSAGLQPRSRNQGLRHDRRDRRLG